MLWLEIQEGKDRMKNIEFQNLGSTTSHLIRGMIATKQLDYYPQYFNKQPPQEPSSDTQELPTGTREHALEIQEQEPK